MDNVSPTEKQTTYARSLQRRLHLPDRMLDDHCASRFGAAFRHLNRAQVSTLLDDLKDMYRATTDLTASRGDATGGGRMT